MSRNWLITLVIIGLLFLGGNVLVWAMTPTTVAAQCGSNPPPDSSCYTCHVQDDPVSGNGEWHGIHANKDCCAKCHGGNCSTMDKDLAHQDMIANPLSDIYTNCHSCHPDDYQSLAVVFAGELGITPSSIPTPTPAPTGKVLASPLVILPSPTSNQASFLPWIPIIWGLFFLVLFAFGLSLISRHLQKPG
jgi:hypothetical protein